MTPNNRKSILSSQLRGTTGALAFFFSMIVGSSLLAQEPGAIGKWKTESNDEGSYLVVEIERCGENLCGNILEAFNKSGEANGEYEHLGKQMIWDMKSKAANKWKGGKIWAPDSDKTYRSKMALNGDTLKVSGCVAGGLICRAQEWSRQP